MNDAHTDQFVFLVTGFQSRLYGYILSLLGDPEQASDVLQETNLVLWHKAGDFELGTNFAAWAFRVAFNQVLAHRQRLGRQRILFNDELVAEMAERATQRSDSFDSRQIALHACLEKLNARQSEFIRRHYSGESVNAIASSVGKSANAIAQALFRARASLMQCIKRRVGQEDQP